MTETSPYRFATSVKVTPDMIQRVSDMAGRSHLILTMLRPRKPLLIVPIRDRRQRRRILTIRNCAIALLSLAVIFAAISIYNDRRSAPAGEYGRLFGSQVPVNAPAPRKVDVITE